ncbi:DUF3444 domain-containing protein [Cephalotus follicularis]|uniref:DUF3444 domain-containing protein n=1 Tax=Cephalotus follicularis TaxID=3775 RepID=A0A1Q3AWU5_CEPFO|nr:DUF3444 domain-containing protein [Cephalotus follicularis]
MNQIIAEADNMIMHNDYANAREKLLQARKLFPAIKNIDSMLTVCDILSAGSIKFPGFGIDHYWILQLMPSCTLPNVRCHYLKLFSLLQSIKTFRGTKLALEHLQDALSVLSDPKKRSEFDFKRGSSRENYATSNVQASFGQSRSDKETVNTAQSSSEYNRNSPSQISNRNNNPAERLSKCGSISVIKQSTEVTFQEPDHLSAVLNSGGIDISTDSINLLTAAQPIRLEGNLEGLMQKRPCQDFYNFENDRRPEQFEAGQIWAAYYRANLHHNNRYALIKSKSQEEVCVTWLKPIPITRSERRWCESGLPVSCGSFRLNPEMCEEVS